MRTPSQLISDCYLAFTAASSHHQDNWLCDETWVRLLIAHYPHLKKTCSLTGMLVTRAITKKAGPFTGPNEFAIFVKQFRTECPYSGERRRVSYFYRQVNGKPPADPVCALLQDDAGFIIKDYLLSILMGSCTDFANEKSQLEFVCQSLGVEALMTTKYHAEYNGEGIEYSWGASKAVYQKCPLACKKGKANFDSLVASRDLLTTERIRKFSRQARSYMLTYFSLQFIHEYKGHKQVMTNRIITHTNIENMKKI
jgi:hypothetical protein